MREQNEKHQKFLTSLLDLFKNWIVISAITATGFELYFTDAAIGRVGWPEIAGSIILVFAFVFLIVSSLCYSDPCQDMNGICLKERFIRVFKSFLSLSIGIFVFLSCINYQENKRIVHMCDQVFDKPNSKAYQAEECVRLRQQRQAIMNQLEGKIRR